MWRCVVLLALGCGGTAPASGRAPTSAAREPATTPTAASPLTDAECRDLADHIVDVLVAAQRAQRSKEEAASDEQVAAIRAQLGEDMRAECNKTIDRTVHRCVMDATSATAIKQCAR